jgi:dihydropteroate synthase
MCADQRAKRDAFLNKIGTRPVIMGILNLIPDSFSDGGRFVAAEAALSHAKRMAVEGCDIIDIGAESTRPGAIPVAEPEEFARMKSVLTEFADTLEVPFSIDTYKSNVAARAVELGAVLVNDVWGCRKIRPWPTRLPPPRRLWWSCITGQKRMHQSIIADIRRFFARSFALAEKAGIARSRILDTRVGFGKTARQNVEVIARLGEILDFGFPILIGVSRKKFLGSLFEGGIEGQLIGTIAASLAGFAAAALRFFAFIDRGRAHGCAEGLSYDSASADAVTGA